MPVYLIFISFLGPKSGSGLPNTSLFSWIFSVKYFGEYLRPHLRTQGQFPNNVFLFCVVMILPFAQGMLPLTLVYFIALYLLPTIRLTNWLCFCNMNEYSSFDRPQQILDNSYQSQTCEMLRFMCTITLSNGTSTTKCILQWLRLLLLQFNSLLVSKV